MKIDADVSVVIDIDLEKLGINEDDFKMMSLDKAKKLVKKHGKVIKAEINGWVYLEENKKG